MDRRETERILAAVRSANADGTRVAIATVVRIRGSAYRREGARMVVRADGSYECLLSGGCLEPAVAEAAARVIATGEPVVVEYDLADDSPWGLSIGCSGAVDVRIERVEADPLTRAWLDLLDAGEAAARITSLHGSAGVVIVTGGGEVLGDLAGDRLRAEAIAEAQRRLARSEPQSGPIRIREVELFFEISEPPAALVIFGAGPDAVPLACQARNLGFLVTVVDAREALLTADRFPGAALKVVDHGDMRDDVPLTSRSHVVVMNHHLERDACSLEHALASGAPYIGVLGPRSRFQTLVARLRAHGVTLDAAGLNRVRSPVGLALGAETPEEVAVSILGEIIALRRGFEGGFLTGRETGLHRPDDSSVFARS
jgi:xanthine/CO dehydrogenase XdhC/CoxF family maturation factor